MNSEVLDYIRSQRVCVVALEMLDGSPHASTVHFAHQGNPLKFFFLTERDSRKCGPLLSGDSSRASVVVGFDEKEMKSFQLDGDIRIVSRDPELAALKNVYFTKLPSKDESLKDNPEFVFLEFVPTWWRFTDWSKLEGKTIYTSDGKVTVNGKIVQQ